MGDNQPIESQPGISLDPNKIRHVPRAGEIAITRQLDELRQTVLDLGMEPSNTQEGGISTITRADDEGRPTETTVWDNKGRISRIENTSLPLLTSNEVFVNEYKYDDQGRLISSKQLIESPNQPPKIYRGNQYTYNSPENPNDYSIDTVYSLDEDPVHFNNAREKRLHDNHIKNQRQVS